MIRKRIGVLVSLAVCLLVSLVCSRVGVAQQQGSSQAAASPLVRVLQAKGILTPEEVAQLNQASSASDADQRLAKLLLSKGIISQADYDQMNGGPAVVAASSNSSSNSSNSSVSMIPTVYRVPASAAANPGMSVSPKAPESPTAALGRSYSDPDPNSSGIFGKKTMADVLPGGAEASTDIAFGTIPPQPAGGAGDPGTGPSVVPAFAPVRVLPVGLMGRESVRPVISAGPIHIQPYGFFKMNIIEESSNPFS